MSIATQIQQPKPEAEQEAAIDNAELRRRIGVLEIQNARLREERDDALGRLGDLQFDLEQSQLARI